MRHSSLLCPQSNSTLWNYSKCGVYTVESEASRLLTSYVGLLPCASTIRRAATVTIIAVVKGEAQ
jgi:hypothetical protein